MSNIRVGIVGLPNVGKSTLFQALTKKQVDTSNYPFATIDPNVGVVPVPDERLEALAKVSVSEKIIPATVEFVDIAGLVKDAHKGEGLGNKFLANIREVDAIVHVVRTFTDSNVHHVSGKVDPASDQETIATELALSDLAAVSKRRETLERQKKSGLTKELTHQLELLQQLEAALGEGKAARTVTVSDDDRPFVRDLNLLTAKPMLVAANVDEAQAAAPPPFGDIALSAKVEADVGELAPDEAAAYLKELGLTSSGLERLIRTSYDLLGLITYFTSGPMETRAWTIHRGTLAPQAAGVIHTDFEKGFIRAEIIGWKDLVAAGSEAKAKEQGLLRLEGKEYVMADGDVAHFRFST
jgi:small GTP-binding protein